MRPVISPESNRYFIAIIPPEPICEELHQLKFLFKDRFSSKASLNSPPHITLHMPFEWKVKKEKLLKDKLTDFFCSAKPFEVTLRDFGCFEPRVIYTAIEKNDAMTELQKKLFKFCKAELNLFNANFKALPFHPHVTLAFRDLKKPMFYKAWEEFMTRKLSATFLCTKITLLKYAGNHWEILHQLDLSI